MKVPTTPGDLTQGVTEALDGFDGYVTLHGARDDYGVVIDPQTMSIDYKATESLRKERRAQFI